jgi:hypothetical protein
MEVIEMCKCKKGESLMEGHGWKAKEVKEIIPARGRVIRVETMPDGTKHIHARVSVETQVMALGDKEDG